MLLINQNYIPMKKYTFLFLFLISVSGYAQQTINNYKYVIVPEKFGFLKQVDKYGLNTLTKTLLEEKGFTVYYDNTALPQEIATNKCTALNAEVTEKKGMFTTTLILLLRDCQNNIIFKSKEGKSREKDYQLAYNMALRDAFTSLDEVPYAYMPATQVKSVTTVQVVAAPANVAPALVAPGGQPAATLATPANAAGSLYAQAIVNGYQLIDTAPTIVLTLLKTSVQDYFIANNSIFKGIVFKRNGEWFFEYYDNNSLISEKLSIKF